MESTEKIDKYKEIYDDLFDEDEQIEIKLLLEEPCFIELIEGFEGYDSIGTGCYPGSPLAYRYLLFFGPDDLRLQILFEKYYNDPAITKIIAKFDENFYIRAFAISKRHEDSELSGAHMRKYGWKKKEYLAFKYALYSFDDVKIESIDEISKYIDDLENEELLLKLVLDADSLQSSPYIANDVILLIINKITDEELLAEIINRSPNFEWTERALRKINDPDLILSFINRFIDHYDLMLIFLEHLDKFDWSDYQGEFDVDIIDLLHSKLIEIEYYDDLQLKILQFLFETNIFNADYLLEHAEELSYSMFHFMVNQLSEDIPDQLEFLENLDIIITESEDISPSISAMWEHLRTKVN